MTAHPRDAPVALPHNVSRLIAWVGCGGWRDALGERTERHAAKVCVAACIQLADIEIVLGDYRVAALWGAAFEDLLATAGPVPGGSMRLRDPVSAGDLRRSSHEMHGIPCPCGGKRYNQGP